MKVNVNASYTIEPVKHTYPRPFKPQVLWWLWIGERRVHSFASKADAMRGAKRLAKLWPAAITVN